MKIFAGWNKSKSSVFVLFAPGIAACVVVLFVVVSCSVSSFAGEIRIADSPVAGDSSLVYELSIGSKERQATIVLSNAGKTVLDISRIVFSNPENFSIYSDHIPGRLLPGESALIEVSFHPKEERGEYQSFIEIYLEGRDKPVDIQVSGSR